MRPRSSAPPARVLARRVEDRPLLPREIDAAPVPAVWRRTVFAGTKLPQGAVGRDAYAVCVLEQPHRARWSCCWSHRAAPSA
ncbi:hypothetical protein [Streptomyces fimbriatus]|uniref:hypothetical protein n=1 Tax=Streptomyces fimbriatus TaxID=68197 RepID=UPI0031D3C353